MALALTKVGETASTITFSWTPLTNSIGYRFTRQKAPIMNIPSGGQRRRYSHTYDPKRNTAEFTKDSDWYLVEAMSVLDSGYSGSTRPSSGVYPQEMWP